MTTGESTEFTAIQTPNAVKIEMPNENIESTKSQNHQLKHVEGDEEARMKKVNPMHIEEPYIEVAAISRTNTSSNINLEDIEKSKGLTSGEATTRLKANGPNELTPPPKISEWMRFLLQFKNMFMVLLNVCGVLSIIAFALQIDHSDKTNLYLGIVLFLVVLLTCLMQWHEEGKAAKVMDSFTNMLATTSTVIRDGKQKEVPTSTLVVGDLVLIKNGDKVPADLVLILCRGLKAECSSLTGESEPISCTDKVSSRETSLLECKNLAFNGSLCYDGMAIGLVVRTGDNTIIGSIAKLTSNAAVRESTLQKEVRVFVYFVAVVSLVLAVVFFIVGVLRQHAKTKDEIITLFINGFLVIIVANTPQGLPATVTSLLSLAARNMASRSILVKRIDCVETLGSCSLIASDKTGTLTKNEMTVTDLWYDNEYLKGDKILEEPDTDYLRGIEPSALLYRIGTICNRAQPISETRSKSQRQSKNSARQSRVSRQSKLSWGGNIPQAEVVIPKFTGNPSDVAVIAYCDRQSSTEYARSAFPILFEVPFNSTNKWMLIIVASLTNSIKTTSDSNIEYEVLMKGAPEVMLKRCSTYATAKGSKEKVVDEKFKADFKETYEKFAADGRRVLAFCARRFSAPKGTVFTAEDSKYNFPTENLNFVGLVAIMDPPRDNVPDAISKCRSAGVKVFMVTGDHPLTARAIASQIGLLDKHGKNIELLEDKCTPNGDWESYDGAVIHGSRIDALTDDQWKVIISKPGAVFARTTPQHKLEIVKHCQGQGNIVAVTGDGVNDAPALKQADVGVAMGLNGSDVAQDAADIVLMDDNFASIVSGIEEGRIIFDNIKKTIGYTMAHIIPEIVSAVVSLAGLWPLGLTAMQVLTIDLGTELGPAISLAHEHAENDIMNRKPRDPIKDRLVSPVLLFYSYIIGGSIISIASILSYANSYSQYGIKMSDFPIKNDMNYFSPTTTSSISVRGRTYSTSDQKRIYSEGVTCFYITLTVSQFFHIWMCKTRRQSLFSHGLKNTSTFYGVILGVALVVFFSYVPGVHDFVGSSNVNGWPWLIALITGSVLWVYNETMKAIFRYAGEDALITKLVGW